MTVSERLKQLREQLGMSQVEFAAKINVSKQTLYKYENNIITNIPSDKIESAARICNVSPAYIMGWGNEIKPITSDTSPELTARDERDIAKDLDRIMGEIQKGDDGPLYYNGVEIDNASLNLLENAIEYALRETKKENKVKYNPNKNKK